MRIVANEYCHFHAMIIQDRSRITHYELCTTHYAPLVPTQSSFCTWDNSLSWRAGSSAAASTPDRTRNVLASAAARDRPDGSVSPYTQSAAPPSSTYHRGDASVQRLHGRSRAEWCQQSPLWMPSSSMSPKARFASPRTCIRLPALAPNRTRTSTLF